MARVFVSHAGDGGDQAREVRRWLVEEGHDVFLDLDRRNGIAAGASWRARLHERLRWADAVVCVVSAASVESRWCAAEVEIARSRGSLLLPLVAESGVVDPALESVQHIDLTQDPVAARAELVAELRRVDAAGGAGWPDDRSPFPGLSPFAVEQRGVFFGRAQEIKELAELLRSPDARGADAALLVVGPSGCGKSSLVRAGLVPVLADEPQWWTLAPLVPGTDPVTMLARELAAAAQRVGLGWTGGQVRRRFDAEGLAGPVEELLLAAPGKPPRFLLVVLDQAEELLTQTAPADRARFAELLRPALGGPLRLVATARSEFLDPLLSEPALSAIAGRLYPVSPLGRAALRAAIEGPARTAGIEVEPELVDRLVEDTDHGDALPLLAFTLAQLAEGAHRGGQLLTARYEQLGGVQGALTRQADAALAAAVNTTGRAPEDVIAGLLRLVTVDEQGRPTRWRARRDQLPAPVAAELDAFVERRLLTTDDTDNGDGGIIGAAHEAFLSAWRPLRDAIAASAAALRARRAVEHAAGEWQHDERPPARLWGGGQLAAAVTDTGAHIGTGPAAAPVPRPAPARRLPRRQRVLLTDHVDLSQTARDFLLTSIRRDRFRRGRTVTVLSVLLVLALVGGGVAYREQRNAHEQQQIATARQLVAQAETIQETDPRTALQLGIAAERLHPGPETDSSLINTLTQTSYAGTLTAHTTSVTSVAFAPHGSTLATASNDGTTLWDLTDLTQPRQLGPPLTGHTKTVSSVAFSPDGRMLATGSGDATVRLWDVTNPVQPRQLGEPLTGHTDTLRSVAFSPDGRTLATSSGDATVRLWDVTNPVQPRQLGEPLTGHAGPVWSVAFSPDGRTLATASNDRAVLRWDIADPTRPRRLGEPLTAHTDGVISVTFSPDGDTLATGSFDDTVRLWDLTGPTQPDQLSPPFTAHTDGVISVAFSPDGDTLATGNGDGTASLRGVVDLTETHSPGPPLTGHTDLLRSVAFSPDGNTLATGSFDDTVRLWDLTGPAQPDQLGPPLTGHTDVVWSVAFSPDGNTLATGSNDGTVILWDLADRTRPQQLGTPLTAPVDELPVGPLVVASVAFSPDGHTLAVAGVYDTVLWDITDRAQPDHLGQLRTSHTGPVFSVAFSPDGRTVATGGGDGTVRLWDLADPALPRQLDQSLNAHTDFVISVAFSPDGHTLATTGKDATVTLWDLTNLAQPHQLSTPPAGHTTAVYSAAFSPDGHTLATSSGDGTLVLWDLTDLNNLRDHPVQRACTIAAGGVNPDQWNRYISGLPYQETCPA